MTEQTYKIGEAAALLNLKSYVLRFWESEFPQLNPMRTESGQRFYSEKDIALLRRICDLLHDRGLTIEGAKKILSEAPPVDDGLSSELLNEGYKDLFDDLDSNVRPSSQKDTPANTPESDRDAAANSQLLLASVLADLKDLKAFIHKATARISQTGL
jgi:DNA-binding transcriptional MerR regulator